MASRDHRGLRVGRIRARSNRSGQSPRGGSTLKRTRWARWRVVLSVVLLAGLMDLVFRPDFLQFVYPIYYQPIIEHEATAANVDPMLVAAITRVESHFREDDISHAGAVGLMQLLPGTASWIAVQIGMPQPTAIQLAQPSINIRLGTWYISYLLKMFHGRLPEAIAAYNAGPNRVSGWLQSNVWSGDEVSIEDIPVLETRHFVARVLYTYRLFHQLYE